MRSHIATNNTAVRAAVAFITAVLVVGAESGPGRAQDATTPAAIEFVAAANLIEHNAKLQAAMLLPVGLKSVRGLVWVVHQGGMSEQFYNDNAVRRMAADANCALVLASIIQLQFQKPNTPLAADLTSDVALGGEAGVSQLLDRLAKDSGRRELREAPILFWGFSASAGFGTSFAMAHPGRTIGFVRYHGGRRGPSMKDKFPPYVPALLVAGGKDEAVGTEDAENMWVAGRAMGAVWTFAIEPTAPHSSAENHEPTMRELTIPWMAAVLRLRLAGDGRLRRISEEGSWLGSIRTGDVVPRESFKGDSRTASWLPDEPSARGWRTVVQRR